MEAAIISDNWLEFSQLVEKRGEQIRSIKEPLPDDVLLQINEIDNRMLLSMSKRKKVIAEKMSKTAKFRKSLKAY
jgi:hypothetical protein